MTIASGCPLFVVQTVLENGTYIKDDKILIKVILDTWDLPDPWQVTGEVDSAGGNSEVLALRKDRVEQGKQPEEDAWQAGEATRGNRPQQIS